MILISVRAAGLKASRTYSFVFILQQFLFPDGVGDSGSLLCVRSKGKGKGVI